MDGWMDEKEWKIRIGNNTDIRHVRHTSTERGEQDIIRTDISSLARNRWWNELRTDRIFLPIRDWQRIVSARTCTDTYKHRLWRVSLDEGASMISKAAPLSRSHPQPLISSLFLVCFPLLFNALLLYQPSSSSTYSLHPSSSFLYCITLKCYGNAFEF